MFTWGSHGHLQLSGAGVKEPSFEPKLLNLCIGQERAKAGYRVFACDPKYERERKPGLKIPPFERIDTITTVQSIDWGLNHCVFVDKKNRVFSMG